MTRRERIIQAIADALKAITTANGYKTNAGENVQIEQWFLDDNYDYLINLFEEDDDTDDEVNGSSLISLALQIELQAKVPPNVSQWNRKHQLISDVKKCLHLYNRNASKDISSISNPQYKKVKPESASQYVETILEINIEYHERAGDPDY